MPSLATLHERRQDQILARADRSADAAEAVVRRVWLDLLAAIKAGGPWFLVQRACAAVLRRLPVAAHAVAEDLAGVAKDSARWTAQAVARQLTAGQRAALLRRRGLQEAERGEAGDLLVGAILPAITGEEVAAVLHAHGWADRLRALTRLVEPDSLAASIATLVTQGATIAEIARAIRPQVQGVQTAARRVARTAGLWVAHEAELVTYEGLGDMIKGYQIHAVLDHATRPEHRKRDGTKYYREPKAGQKSMAEMPHPPREADGSWAFNCRCWLAPILSQ